MKIGFISEYYPPYAPGGAEWSIYYLAKELTKKKDIKVYVLTPNYGTQDMEDKNNLIVYRFPFYKKLSINKIKLSEFDHLNPWWILWQCWHIIKFYKKHDVDLLHIHGKYSLPAAYLANILLRKKMVTTIRDYQVICNYGFCIYDKNKACNLREYFQSDFKKYWDEYVVVKSLRNLVINLVYAFWGRISTRLLRVFAKKYNVVVLSLKQAEIFKANGFSKVRIIHNSISFENNIKKGKKEKQILFAGRLTPGKGVDLLIDLLPNFFSKHPNYKFIFSGEGMLKNKLLNLSKKYNNLVVLGSIDHDELLNLYKKSSVTVVPSLWQEPFGRIALESLRCVTPVVVTNKGGLPEIVENNKWGYVVKATTEEVLMGIEKAIEKNDKLINQIIKDYPKLKNKFGNDIVNEYLNIYQT